MKSIKSTIDDGCNPELVRGLSFDGVFEIPKIEAPSNIWIPTEIKPFSKRRESPDISHAISFYENDTKFSGILSRPDEYLDDFSKYGAIISPDFSLYRDAPIAVQITNIYRNRAIGGYLQRKGFYVIPDVRWGNDLTYTTKAFPERVAFLGVEKNSIVAIGTYGCIKSKEDKYYFREGLEAMLETLEPKVVLVYGSMPEKTFRPYERKTTFVPYPDWTTRKHGGVL